MYAEFSPNIFGVPFITDLYKSLEKVNESIMLKAIKNKKDYDNPKCECYDYYCCEECDGPLVKWCDFCLKIYKKPRDIEYFIAHLNKNIKKLNIKDDSVQEYLNRGKNIKTTRRF